MCCDFYFFLSARFRLRLVAALYAASNGESVSMGFLRFLRLLAASHALSC
jgi:hypothetical protein